MKGRDAVERNVALIYGNWDDTGLGTVYKSSDLKEKSRIFTPNFFFFRV